MSKKPFRGHSGKSVWENTNFRHGMRYTDEPLREKAAKGLTNFDVSRTGGTIEVRDPFYSAAFKMPENDLPQGLSKDTVLFKSTQDTTNEFLINIGSERQEMGYLKLTYDNVYMGSPSPDQVEPFIRIIDGDTVAWGDFRFRLLAIDAPELDDAVESPTEDFEKGEVAQEKLFNLIDEGQEIYVVYDKRSDSYVDKYGRRLVWLYRKMQYADGMHVYTVYENLNLEMLKDPETGTRLMGGFDEDIDVLHFPHYRGSTDSDWWGNINFEFDFPEEVAAAKNENDNIDGGKDIEYHDFIPKTINVYTKPSQTELNGYHEEGYVKIPVIELHTVLGQVDLHQLYEDLEIHYGVPVRIELNNQAYSKGPHHTEYKPWTRLEDIDGIVFLGTVYASDEEVYKGIISVRYYIPLEDNTPLFNNAAFKVETYKNNAFSVKFEELNNRYNLNLLDPDIPGRKDFIGDEAEQNNYHTYLMPTIGVLNENDQFVNQLAQGRNYTLRPFYVLPEIDESEGYNGYAVKWDFFTNDNYFQNKFLQAFSSFSRFPETGSTNTIYIATSEDNQHYRWDGNNYIPQDAPTPVETTGWRLTFDRFGEPIILDEFYTYNRFEPILEGEDDVIEGFNTIKVISNWEYNDQKNMSISFIREGETLDGETVNIFNSQVIKTDFKSLKFFLELNYHYYVDFITEPFEIIGQDPEETEERELRVTFYSGENGDGPLGSVPLSEFGYTSGDLQEWTININNSAVQAIPDIETTQSIRIRDIAFFQPGGQTEFRAYYQVYKGESLQGDPVENPISDFNGYEFPGNISENNFRTIETDDPIFQTAKASSQGNVYCRVHLSRLTVAEGGHVESDVELDAMSRIQSLMAKIRSQEELEVQYQHGQNLHDCRGITAYKGQLVLYDSPKASTVLYMSDVAGNISYFPFKRALDQFYSDIVHVQPVQQGLIVFTTDDIYLVYEVEDEMGEVIFMADVIYSSLTIKPHNRNTVRSSGRDILFIANNSVLMLRPNPYVDDIRDMFLEDISIGIKELFERPMEYLQERLIYYGEDFVLEDLDPTIEYYTIVKNDEFWIHMSVHIPGHAPFMIVAVYVRAERPHYWKLYDTRACAFPYNHAIFNPVEGYHTLVRNDRDVNGGVTMMLTEALNLWDFAEDYGKVFDIQTVKIDEGEFIYNLVEMPEMEDYQDDLDYKKIKHPIRASIDTGYMDITSHLNKRFHKFHLEIHNVDALKLPMYIQFNIDGNPRQTSEHAQMTQDEQGHITYQHEFKAVQETSTALLNLWELDLSVFEAIKKFKIDFGISGKGRLPQMIIGFKATGKFRLYRYGIVFKEQSAR